MLNLAWGADTMVRRVAIITAWARIHRGNQHERAGIFYIVFGATDADFAVFQGLAQHFKDATAQLGHLVKKEHPVMGQTDFTRLRIIASTHQGYLRNGVVRSTEGTLADEARVATELSCHTMNLGGFQALCQ